MKANYKNWVPGSMVIGLFALAAVTAVLFVLAGLCLDGKLRIILMMKSGIITLILLDVAIWMFMLYRAFDYNGKRQLAKEIIEKTAEYVKLPEKGKGLDVGCGSGALTIACAKNNPQGTMYGCDIWSGSYKGVFSKKLCEDNAKAEGVDNVCFVEGNAVKLPFEDESFDAVTSNYVYHNIAGKNKQELLLETFRVLKKGGTFAIHDLMSKYRYGDMSEFVKKLKEEGYEEVELIDTTDGSFMSHKESVFLGLNGSTLLCGRK